MRQNGGEAVQHAVEVADADPAAEQRKAGPINAALPVFEHVDQLEGQGVIVGERRQGFALYLDAGRGIEVGDQFFSISCRLASWAMTASIIACASVVTACRASSTQTANTSG